MHDNALSRRHFIWTATAFGAAPSLLYFQERQIKTSQAADPSDLASVVSVTNGASRRQDVAVHFE